MCELRIDEDGLRRNIRLVRQLAGGARVIGVVKGNGYGLGLLELAGRLTDWGVRHLAVSELEEGLTLRRCEIPAEIMLLTPLYDPADLELAIQARLILCIDSPDSARAAQTAAAKLGLQGRGQLCVDTGFGRYGFPWQAPETACVSVGEMKNIRLVGTYSHLSRSGSLDGSFTLEQFHRFTGFCDALKAAGVEPGLRHLADSYGLLRHPEIRLDAVRIGSAFLGRLPFPDEWGFVRIGELSAPVREVRTIAPGSTVGYGGGYVARRETRIAVVGAGYSHGFGLERHKTAAPGGLRAALKALRRPRQTQPLQVAAGERQLAVLGPVGMCATVVDATGAPLQVGDRVTLPVNPLFVNPEVPRCYL